MSYKYNIQPTMKKSHYGNGLVENGRVMLLINKGWEVTKQQEIPAHINNLLKDSATYQGDIVVLRKPK